MTNIETVIPGTSLFFEGRAWLDTTGGNTYHTVRIWINGEVIEITPRAYGYENAYQQTAIEALVKLGYLPQTIFRFGEARPTREFSLWQIDREFQITTYSVLSYGKKSELFKI